MSQPIFREKSLQKVKSPDNLDEYIRVANPGVWTLLAAIIILLLGFCSWAVFGSVRTVVHADARCEKGVITCTLSSEDASRVSVGMPVKFGSYSGTVTEIVVREGAQSTCTVSAAQTVPDGTYDAAITVENIHPVSFLTN